MSLAAVLAVALDGRLQRPDWRGLADALRARPGRVIFAVNGCQLLPLSLYLRGLEFAAPGGPAAREVDVVTAADQASWYRVLFTGSYVTCRPQRQITLPAQLGGFRQQGSATRVGAFTVFRFRSSEPLPVGRRLFSAAGLRGALMAQTAGATAGTAGYSAP